MPQADPRPRLVKVVRTEIARHLGDGEVFYRQIKDRDALVAELRKKLLEEVAEYLVEPCIGELADVLEVAHALAHNDLLVPWTQVEEYAAAKANDRGSFDAGMGMYVTTNAPHEFEENGRAA